MDETLFCGNCQQILTHLFEGVFFIDENNIIKYWSPGAEQITGYRSFEIVGKQFCSEFLVHIDHNGEHLCNTTECPLSSALRKVQACEVEAYLNHKEGHRIPVSIRTFPLSNEKNEIIGAAEVFRDNSPREFLAKELADLKDQATIDPLTGLRNRRYAEIVINSKLNELREESPPFGVLFFDIDHFKYVNDTFGHDVGDLVLKMLAKTLISNTRESDVLVRWGGEEIIAVLSGPGISRKILSIAEKLRNLIRKSTLQIAGNQHIQVTVSIGATVAHADDTVDSLIKRADKLMYQAKKEGRNRVKLEL